ncbi:hypothetical protein [Streptomyces drozdowiczii]|uniref:Uncharacterized protein n=1 Tax=Streptomyces drozdowiczii TaxID=202862 RepID=A0ABY6PVI9_9ACTN|nr:hypothetical protein [Streptomyces drozdowiczii]MCX0244043.1 hypothetical protein [Streptomyces drozdowiczii]UZK56126.1 hypothetical protein NEH16_20270 [Streptomyces drozdowiczii]
MAGDDWDDDRAYDDAVRRARRATRVGWTAISGTVTALGCAAVLVAVACLLVVLVWAYLVVSVNR